MNITKYEKYFFILPAFLSVVAIAALVMWGLKPGIDLSGGSLLQVSYPTSRPTAEQIHTAVDGLGFGEVRVQPTGDTSYILRQRDLTNEEKNTLETALGKLGTVKEDQYNSVGPTIGSELVRKAWIAITLVVLCIIAFIAFAFRGVSKPVASWKYGIVAIITLLHDILLPLGLFAALGHFIEIGRASCRERV